MSTFGGFGSTNNNQQSSGGFGSFGNTNNNSGGFGTGSSLFGNTGTANNAAGTFGNSSSTFGSGFGSNNNNGAQQNTTNTGFGTRPSLFGAQNNSTSLFGSSNTGSSSNAFGSGFGGNNATNNSNSSNTGGFGSSNTTGSLFGNNNNTGSGNALGFGSAGTGFGQQNNTNTPALPPNNGTAGPPFAATPEKDGLQTTYFQSINFMPAYNKYSFEELRRADYDAGRRFGNQASSGFGNNSIGFGSGFGTTNSQASGGLFGSTTNSSNNGFGVGSSNINNTNSTSGFGGFGGNQSSATGGGLFGSSNTQSNSQPGFGSGSGFGGGNNASTSGFGGFGAQKPANSLFGNTNTTGSGFGGASGFGNNNNNQQQAGGSTFGGNLFGGGSNNNQPQANNSGFGTGGSLFGGGNNNGQGEQKPSSLFGGTNPGGLFGGSNQQNPNNQAMNQQPSTGLFGTPAAGAGNAGGTGGGIFGKPPTVTSAPATGLFGQSSTTTGGGLFGGQAAQAQSNSLFGGPTQTAKPGSLFAGATNPTSGSGGIFGGSNTNQNASGSLFGGSQSQPNSSTSSIFNSSSQQSPFQVQSFTTSISDGNAFGNQPLFASLNTTPTQSLGPLATPLSTSQKQKHPAVYPSYRRNPFEVPRTPLSQGYGLSYSRYGTPSSAMSSIAGTPRANGISLLGNSLAKPLGKSTSMINLSASYRQSEGVFSPNAFSAGGRRPGAMRRLMIDRSVRSDLFSPQETPKALPTTETIDSRTPKSITKKKVSFEATANEGGVEPPKNIFAQANGSMVDESPTSSESTLTNGTTEKGGSFSGPSNGSRSDSSSITSKELTIVPEEGAGSQETATRPRHSTNGSSEDPKPGDYWMEPRLSELKSFSRERLTSVKLTVGRENCGQVEFDPLVDLTGIKLEDIPGKIVDFQLRKCTVYPDNAIKPVPGRGLNVPATIELEHSGPQKGKGRRAQRITAAVNDRHIEKLKRIENTKFILYDVDTKLWIFSVQHFTTYGIDDDDESEIVDADMEGPWADQTSELNPLPDASQTRSLTRNLDSTANENTMNGLSDEDDLDRSPDDTFGYRKSRSIPGSFGKVDLDFLHDSTATIPSGVKADEDHDISMDAFDSPIPPRDHEVGIVRPRVDEAAQASSLDIPADASPPTRSDDSQQGSRVSLSEQDLVSLGPVNIRNDEDWTERLRQSVSPSKKSRRHLIDQQDDDTGESEEKEDDSIDRDSSWQDRANFATSIDIMKYLYGRSRGSNPRARSSANKQRNGFSWSLAKATELDRSVSSLSQEERDYYSTTRLHWGQLGRASIVKATGGLVPARAAIRGPREGTLHVEAEIEISEASSLRIVRLESGDEAISSMMQQQLQISQISMEDGTPKAHIDQQGLPLTKLGEHLSTSTHQMRQEKTFWSLLSLFDQMKDEPEDAQMEALSYRWSLIVKDQALSQVHAARSSEERAIAFLSAHMIEEACSALMEGGNFHLATMTARIGTDAAVMQDMAEQLSRFRSSKILSEFNDPIRALYELLSGNVGVAQGQAGAPEDRVQPFTIATKFNMDWRQAFGLHLWYSSAALSTVDVAIAGFEHCVRTIPDYPQPHACSEEGSSSGSRDILWTLIRLSNHQVHHRHSKDDVDISEFMSSFALSNNALEARMAWQAVTYLEARSLLHPHATRAYTGQLDRLCIEAADQISWTESWPLSFLPLLSLSDAATRRTYILRALEANVQRIQGDKACFQFLAKKLLIPEQWIWRACSVLSKSLNDYKAMTYCYLKCDDDEGRQLALEAVITFLGPQAIVSGDLTALDRVLRSVYQHPVRSELQTQGQIYRDYISLVIFNRNRHTRSLAADTRDNEQEEIEHVVKRLIQLLKGKTFFGGQSSYEATMERVAFGEMSKVAVRTAMEIGSSASTASTEVLGLPITGLGYRETAVDLAMQHFQELIVG